MSEMIERVAKAIHDLNGYTPWDKLPADDTSFGTGKTTRRAQARAAIEAMSEPTEEMMDPCSDPWGDPLGTTKSTWQSMIEAALH